MALYKHGRFLKYLTFRGRVCTSKTIITVSVPCEKNKDLSLFARIHSVVRSNIEDKVLPPKHQLFFQSDLFNRLVITEDQERHKFIGILNIECFKPICKKYKKCVCRPKSSKIKVFSPRHKYQKIIQKKFCEVSLIIHSNLTSNEFNHFDISVTLEFCKTKK